MQCGLNDAVGPVFIEDGDMKGLSEGLRQQVDEGECVWGVCWCFWGGCVKGGCHLRVSEGGDVWGPGCIKGVCVCVI